MLEIPFLKASVNLLKASLLFSKTFFNTAKAAIIKAIIAINFINASPTTAIVGPNMPNPAITNCIVAAIPTINGTINAKATTKAPIPLITFLINGFAFSHQFENRPKASTITGNMTLANSIK